MSKNNIHIFLTTITIAGFTTPVGVSYSFIFLAFLYIIKNANYFLRFRTLIFLLFIYSLFRIGYLREGVLSVLNFSLVFLLMIGLKNYRPTNPKLFLKFYIQLSLTVVLLQILLKEQFGLFFNQVYSSPEALGEEWRPNGISFEPSMASLFIILAGYSLGKSLNLLYTLFIGIQIVLLQSVFGYAGFIFLLIYRWFKIKYWPYLTPIIPLLLVTILNTNILKDVEAIERLNSVIISSPSLQVDALVSADHSASVRIAPFLILATQPWWQHGLILPKSMEAYKDFIANFLPGIDTDYWAGGGFLPSSIYTLGFFSLILYYFIYKNFTTNYTSVILLTICLANIPFSSQAFAVLLILLKVGMSLNTHRL